MHDMRLYIAYDIPPPEPPKSKIDIGTVAMIVMECKPCGWSQVLGNYPEAIEVTKLTIKHPTDAFVESMKKAGEDYAAQVRKEREEP